MIIYKRDNSRLYVDPTKLHKNIKEKIRKTMKSLNQESIIIELNGEYHF